MENNDTLEVIQRIPLDKLRPYPDHPFGVRDDDMMQQTVESIKQFGVLVPGIARPLPDGTFELIAGHRRKQASAVAGLDDMPIIVRDIDRNAATIIMVDSNLQRENILPSEKAKAYKMKLEAIKRQAGRPGKNSAQVGQNFEGKTSRAQIAENSPDSSSQIQRYIRLNELEPELLQLVDEGKIGRTPAVEISYLTPDEQRLLIETIDSEQATPSFSQAQRMLYDGNTEAMAFEAEDIVLFSGCFGITREDWDAIKDQIPPMDMDTVRKKREQAFLESPGDTYAIYQLKRDDATTDLRFMNSDWLSKKGIEPQPENYDLIYTGALYPASSQIETLERLYQTFNIDHPADFTGHSLSVSDIVALKKNGVVSCHYVESVGYKELPSFIQSGNYLKNAEMQMEDDYGMIDGIVNNGPRQTEPPAKPAPEKQVDTKSKKPSVLAKLRQYQEEDRKATTMHRSAERDLI